MPEFEIRPYENDRDLYIVPPERGVRRYWRLYIGAHGAGVHNSRLCYQADRREVEEMALWLMREGTC